jgi:hypothetical protein
MAKNPPSKIGVLTIDRIKDEITAIRHQLWDMPCDFVADAFGIEEEDLAVKAELVCAGDKNHDHNHPRKPHFHGPGGNIIQGAVKWEVKRGRSGVDDHGDSGKVCAGQKNNETPRKRISMIVEKDSPGIVQLFQPKCSDRSIIRKFSTGNTLNQWKQENEQEKDE